MDPMTQRFERMIQRAAATRQTAEVAVSTARNAIQHAAQVVQMCRLAREGRVNESYNMINPNRAELATASARVETPSFPKIEPT